MDNSCPVLPAGSNFILLYFDLINFPVNTEYIIGGAHNVQLCKLIPLFIVGTT